MSEFLVNVRAPSNIALIKYMGKKDSASNIPENPSLSLTLNSLCTLAEITSAPGKVNLTGGWVHWIPEAPRSVPQDLPSTFQLQVPLLTDSAVARVVRHFERVRNALPLIFQKFGLDLDLERWKEMTPVLRTANTFPTASGIASSASSFAALTLAVAAAYAKNYESFERALQQDASLRRALAQVSRQGSGSSCRSFEGPWVYWEGQDTFVLPSLGMPEVAHFVILIKTEPKKVSSSSAHSLIRTSPLWDGRVERVQHRTSLVMEALNKGDLAQVARVTWAEAWEMHSLFHTCAEPFSYWEPGTLEGLQWFAPLMHVAEKSDFCPPIVTLDAGPNIHVIVEKKQREQWSARLKERFSHSRILEDLQGSGAQMIHFRGGK